MTDEHTIRTMVQRIRDSYPPGIHGHEMAVQDIYDRDWALSIKESALNMLDRRNVSTAMVEFGELKEGEL